MEVPDWLKGGGFWEAVFSEETAKVLRFAGYLLLFLGFWFGLLALIGYFSPRVVMHELEVEIPVRFTGVKVGVPVSQVQVTVGDVVARVVGGYVYDDLSKPKSYVVSDWPECSEGIRDLAVVFILDGEMLGAYCNSTPLFFVGDTEETYHFKLFVPSGEHRLIVEVYWAGKKVDAREATFTLEEVS